MNVVFVSDDSNDAGLLKKELSRYAQASKDDSLPDVKNVPVDLRHVSIQQIGVTQDGRLQLPDNGLYPGDIVVLDSSRTGSQTLHTIRDTVKRVPGVPVIVLTDPEEDLSAVEAIAAGAADCIAKAENCFQRIWPVVEREIRYQALNREKTDILSREQRLRVIVENLPVGVGVIAPNGTFLAVNQSGIANLAFTKLDQVVGKNILDFVAEEDKDKVQKFLDAVGGGSTASLVLDWKGQGEKAFNLKLSATPMRRQGIQGSAVLTAIYSTAECTAVPDEGKEPADSAKLNRALEEYETRLKEQEKNHDLQKEKWINAVRHEEILRREAEEKQAQREREHEELEKKVLDSENKHAAAVASLKAAEEKRIALEAALRETEENLSQRTGQYEEERTRGEELRRELERKSGEEEQQRIAAQSGVQEIEARKNALEAALKEAEEKRTALENELRAGEENRKQLAESFEQERSQREELRRELEQKSGEEEQHRIAAQSGVQEIEDRKNALEELLREAEEKQAVLAASLREAEENLRQKDEQYNLERSLWGQARQEWERKVRAADQQRVWIVQSTIQESDEKQKELKSALRKSEEKRTALESELREKEENRRQQAESFEQKRAQWERDRQQLEQRVREAEEKPIAVQAMLQEAGQQLSAIETALREKEENHRQKAESFEQERAQWERDKQQLEQRIHEAEQKQETVQTVLQEVEEKRAVLEAALRETEETRNKAMEVLNTERSQWEQARQDSDRKLREAEEIQRALEASIRGAESFEQERAQWERDRQQLERKVQEAEKERTVLSSMEEQKKALEEALRKSENERNALETSLREARESAGKLAEQYDAERLLREQAYQDFEMKLREAENQHAIERQETKQEAENRYNRLNEKNHVLELELGELRQRAEQLKRSMESLQADLSEEKKRVQRFSQATSIGIVVTTADGMVLECNDFAARMFGYSDAGEALSQEENGSIFRLYSFHRSLGKRLHKEGMLENVEWSSQSRDGRVVRIRENALLIEGTGGGPPRIQRALTDITTAYRLSGDIRRMHKAESTGILMNSAVKNFQNLCESLIESSKQLKGALGDSNKIEQVSETLLKEADRGSKYARQLLSVSTRNERVPAIVNLNEILAENDTVLRSLLGAEIDLQIESSPGACLVEVDRQEIVKLTSNLVVSALKTLPLGGAVSIGTENIEIDAAASGHPEDMPSGLYALMAISVDGCEVRSEKSSAFNQTIVDRMGGWISSIEDAPSGYRQKIYLPRVEAFAGRKVLPLKVTDAGNPPEKNSSKYN